MLKVIWSDILGYCAIVIILDIKIVNIFFLAIEDVFSNIWSEHTF